MIYFHPRNCLNTDDIKSLASHTLQRQNIQTTEVTQSKHPIHFIENNIIAK